MSTDCMQNVIICPNVKPVCIYTCSLVCVRWTGVITNLTINSLSPHDALKHHFENRPNFLKPSGLRTRIFMEMFQK